jgi:Enolase C-terminal domain-like
MVLTDCDKPVTAARCSLQQSGALGTESRASRLPDQSAISRARRSPSSLLSGPSHGSKLRHETTRQLHELRDLIIGGCIDVLQPDVALVGGITGLRRIALLAQEHHLAFPPHTWTDGPSRPTSRGGSI